MCTLGWNVTNASTAEEGILTAGHCVNNPEYGTVGTRFANHDYYNNTLGTVQLNPPWNDAVLGYGGVDDCQGYYPCTHRADMRDGQTDSGSPVFYDNGNGRITPLGVLWGWPNTDDPSYNWGIDQGNKFCQLNCYILFSDLQRIAMHLGTGFYPEYY